MVGIWPMGWGKRVGRVGVNESPVKDTGKVP